MRNFTTIAAVVVGLLLMPASLAFAQDYPPGQPSGATIECSFDGSTVDCTARGFEANSEVTGTVSANGETRRTDQLTANAEGVVSYRFQPVCDVDRITVEVSGTNANGEQASAQADVDISSCRTGGGTALPRTGGGVALLGLALIGTAAAVRRRA